MGASAAASTRAVVCSSEWKVSTHGSPSRRAARTAAYAAGETTLACAWTTS
jgi:hypothetical protein